MHRLISILLAGAAAASVSAGSLCLIWNRSPDPRATGYVLVYGPASGSYNQSTNVGNVSEATVTGLAEGQIYYFACYAYSSNNLQSDLSNEVCYQIPLFPSAPLLPSPNHIEGHLCQD